MVISTRREVNGQHLNQLSDKELGLIVPDQVYRKYQIINNKDVSNHYFGV